LEAFVRNGPRTLPRNRLDLRDPASAHFAFPVHVCAQRSRRWQYRWRYLAAACSAAEQAAAVADSSAVARPASDFDAYAPGVVPGLARDRPKARMHTAAPS
jgi:hypothetical protein